MNATPQVGRSTFPRVVIVGRMNVGKSTLFNRLTESRSALISSLPGTTRDTNEAVVSWRTSHLLLIDTGGADVPPERSVDREAVERVHGELAKADLALFVVDGQRGLIPADRELAKVLRRSRVPTILVMNKVDAARHRRTIDPAFISLGFSEGMIISARTGVGTGDLLDRIVEMVPVSVAEMPSDQRPVRVTIIGRPNAGKSSILNMLLGEPRSIVSDEPLTTRETHTAVITHGQTEILLRDTVGIRRPSRLRSGEKTLAPLAREGVRQSLGALGDTDVALLVLDVTEPMSRQDIRLARRIIEARANVLLIGNKIDRIHEQDVETIGAMIRRSLPQLPWAPIIFTSATGGRGREEILDFITVVLDERQKRLSDPECDTILKAIVRRHPPTIGKGTKRPTIEWLVQTRSAPPTFDLAIHRRQSLNLTYLTFVERMIREMHGFLGTPITIHVVHVDDAQIRSFRYRQKRSRP